jgi:hypothetical protein
MTDISGGWEFHRSCLLQTLDIPSIEASGAFFEATLTQLDGIQRAISGHYNAEAGTVSFNDGSPGQTLYVSFYSGYVMTESAGNACAMAGTFREAEIIIEVIGEEVRFAGAGGRPVPVITTVHSGWYAVWAGPIMN